MSRSNPILSLNPLFYGKHNSNSGKTTLGLYNGGLMADRGHPNHIYKILLLHLCFYIFYPNSLFQPPTLFSPHPSGGLRCSRWPSDLEQLLGKLLLMGSLPEQQSKVIGMSSRIAQTLTVRTPPCAVRLPGSVRQCLDHRPGRSDPLPLGQRPYVMFWVHVDMFV
jgi:hypothetical protein